MELGAGLAADLSAGKSSITNNDLPCIISNFYLKKSARLAGFQKIMIPLLILNIFSVIEDFRYRVGGCSRYPSSHTTVRALSHTAVLIKFLNSRTLNHPFDISIFTFSLRDNLHYLVLNIGSFHDFCIDKANSTKNL